MLSEGCRNNKAYRDKAGGINELGKLEGKN